MSIVCLSSAVKAYSTVVFKAVLNLTSIQAVFQSLLFCVLTAEYDFDKLVDYPGFNVGLPAGTIDVSNTIDSNPDC